MASVQSIRIQTIKVVIEKISEIAYMQKIHILLFTSTYCKCFYITSHVKISVMMIKIFPCFSNCSHFGDPNLSNLQSYTK